MSKLKEWFISFYKDYFSINLKDYHNIGIDVEIVKILFLVALALCICYFLLDYHRKSLYILVKQLMRHEAKDEASAKTLGEMGLLNERNVKRALACSSQLRSIVGRVGEVRPTYEEYIESERARVQARREARELAKQMKKEGLKPEPAAKENKDEIDFTSARFYIKADHADLASKIFNGAEISVWRTILRCVLTVAVFVCSMLAMPEFLDWVNNILG